MIGTIITLSVTLISPFPIPSGDAVSTPTVRAHSLLSDAGNQTQSLTDLGECSTADLHPPLSAVANRGLSVLLRLNLHF